MKKGETKMESKGKIDPVTVAVLDNRLASAAAEMANTMIRTSRSPVWNEAHDFCTVIFDKNLRVVAQKDYIPLLAWASPFPMQEIARFAQQKGIKKGDVFIHNDPYTGNNHQPDVNVVKPVFYQGKLVFWSVAKGHLSDIGGSGKGALGFDPSSRSVWADGLILPAAKLYERGKLNEALWNVILANVKYAWVVEGDLMCEVGSVNVGERRLIELLDMYGVETVETAIDEILAATEREVREKIRGIPDGVYYGEGRIDHDGVIRDKSIIIRAKVTKEGSDLTIDFSESDAQRPGPLNSTFANTASNASLAVHIVLPGEMKRNSGSMAPIKVIAPKGLVANCESPSPVVGCTVSTAEAIVESVLKALAQAVPEWVMAGSCKILAFHSAGFNPRTKRPFVFGDFFDHAGSGATMGVDGGDEVGSTISSGRGNTPDIEIIELVCPIRMLEFQIVPDRAGAGKWRGGNGMVSRFEVLADGIHTVTQASGLMKESASFGVAGGKPAPPNEAWEIKPGGQKVWRDCNLNFEPEKGSTLGKYLMGGGGWGNPFERPIEKVREDVINEFVSVQKAREDYGVVIDPVTLEVNYQKTAEMRARRG